MITPIEAIPFDQVLASEKEKLNTRNFTKNPQNSDLSNLEAKTQPQFMPGAVNALFDGAEGNKIQFENQGNETIIKIVNPDTDEVVRQIPPEELMAMRDKMSELQAQFIDGYA